MLSHDLIDTSRWPFARRVERLSIESGMDRSALAAAVSCSRRTLTAMLRRDVGVGIDRVAAFASVFECSSSHMLDEGDVDAPPTSLRVDMPSVRRILAKNVERLL